MRLPDLVGVLACRGEGEEIASRIACLEDAEDELRGAGAGEKAPQAPFLCGFLHHHGLSWEKEEAKVGYEVGMEGL